MTRSPRPAPWDIIYYQPELGRVPAGEFLDGCPDKVEATIIATLEAVAAGPPPQFSGGGYWEAMHGSMKGYYEVRVTGPEREQFRLFCILDNAKPRNLTLRGLSKPAIAVITGMRKPNRAVFSPADYGRVRDLGEAYKSDYPRKIAT